MARGLTEKVKALEEHVPVEPRFEQKNLQTVEKGRPKSLILTKNCHAKNSKVVGVRARQTDASLDRRLHSSDFASLGSESAAESAVVGGVQMDSERRSTPGEDTTFRPCRAEYDNELDVASTQTLHEQDRRHPPVDTLLF